MSTLEPIQSALEAWRVCQAQLSTQLNDEFVPATGDPQPFTKHERRLSIIRLRILPRTKVPPRFWSSSHCFYELGVGQYDNAPLILGGVSFLQFSSQKVCGAGHYASEVWAILRSTQQLRSEDFQTGNTSGGGALMPSLSTRYRANSHQRSFPVETAGKDLAWLIAQTFPRFQQLAHAPR
jgi:hypothetical protein